MSIFGRFAGRSSPTRTIAVVGPADPDLAWRRYVELDRWATWAPPIRRVTADLRELHRGLAGTVHTVVGLEVPFSVLEVDEQSRSWTWRVTLGRLEFVMRHEVLPRPGGGSVATLGVDGPWVPVAGYLPIARIALHRLVGV